MEWAIRLVRAPGIELREAPDGMVAYDAGRDRIHYLNRSASLLLQMADGNLSAAELADLLAAAFALAEPPTGEVEACLGRLLDEGLLIDAGEA